MSRSSGDHSSGNEGAGGGSIATTPAPIYEKARIDLSQEVARVLEDAQARDHVHHARQGSPGGNAFKKGHRIRFDVAWGDSPALDFGGHYYGIKVGSDTYYHDKNHPHMSCRGRCDTVCSCDFAFCYPAQDACAGASEKGRA